ncbi:MAG: ABC transporter ATP-binding protein [Oscillospiraceae bacterium]|jgi:osmoprotectant transport system ATP-binding protein|nr:ABC transporter ATP-binding protein [Oscillospiraceae bacterium]MCI1991373.1 ABC transporter ATP-binding protein [Oscillospiraceae bacterium]MCI2034658.1 ABC transporter ATP-binding protein [Oscillospiraceae bacterium]
MRTAVEFRSVRKRFPKASYDAVSDVSLKINEGEIVTILGTSGCGKTTLLKMVNRLYEPDSGEILFFGQPIRQMNPVELRRKIGYVIQQVGLFPHMNIGENIATVPKILGWPKQKIEKRVDELLELVQLPAAEFKKRYPHQLSGGQQQRVGLARALAADPAIMLLDEPFGAIDAITRRSLQDELLSIHRKFRKTFLFVTHDIHEAFRLADRVLILDAGKVQQFAAPAEICSKPACGFVEKLVDSAREEQLEWKAGGAENDQVSASLS